MRCNFTQKNASKCVVSAIVRVFDVFEVPVVRISPVVVRPPNLPAVDAMAQKGIVDGNHMDAVMCAGHSAQRYVVSRDDLQAIGPARQRPSALGIADSVRW